MVGMQTFLADGNKVAISKERQYAKVWTQEDCHLCHKLSKPGLLIIVSLLAIHSPWCSDRQSCDGLTTHPRLLYYSSSLWLQNIFCYKRWFSLWIEFYRFAPHLQNGITVRTPHESHVTGSLQWHYQKLPLLITAVIAVWLSHGLRQWPCNAILPTQVYYTS